MYGYKNTITETRPKAAQPVPKPVPIRVYMYISLYDALMVKGYLYTIVFSVQVELIAAAVERSASL